MPSLPPRTLAALTMLGRQVHRERDVDALRAGDAAASRSRQSRTTSELSPRADPVHRRAGDAHALEHDVLAVAHLDPDLAAETVTSRTVTSSERIDDPAADDVPPPFDALRAVEDERPSYDPAGEPHGRRLRRPTPLRARRASAAGAAAARAPPPRPSSPPSSP